MHIPVNMPKLTSNNNEEVTTTHEATSLDDEQRTPKTRSLCDLYDATSELHLVCLLAQGENISFEEAIGDDKWRAAMNDEMRAIEKNEIWSYPLFQKITRR
jgi:hypothetical protein